MEEKSGSFDDFSVELEDFEYKQVKKFDRIFNLGEGGSFTQEPCIHNGIAYLACLDRNVYAINAENGEPVWRFEASAPFATCSPVMHENVIYIGGYDHNLYALDAGSGEMLWKFVARDKLASSVCVNNGKVYFGSKDQNMYCVDSKTGELIWKFATQGEVVSMPAFYEGKLLFGSYDRFLYCVDAESGTLIWKFETQGDIYNITKLLVHDDIVYFPSFDNYLRAVDVNTGKLVWKFLTGSYGGMGSGPLLNKDTLYQANREGVIYALTMEGKEKARIRINEVFAYPLLYDEKIFVGSGDHNLYCIDLNCRKLWTFPTQHEVWYKPAAHGSRVYFTSWDCNMYCVDINTRRLLWKFRGKGSPSYMPPAFESYELVLSRSADDSKTLEDASRKTYDIEGLEEECTSEYKSRVTYQVSTQYAAKGKYQIDSDEEEF